MPDSRQLARRSLLRAAAVTPAVAASSALWPGFSAPAAQAAEASGPVDPRDPRFTLAVMPDTQYLFDEGGSDPGPVREALMHLMRRRREDNIVFLAHLGDVTEHGTEAEMRAADEVFRSIDGRLPYSMLAGNHDVPGNSDDQRGATPYLRTFGPDRFRRMPTYGGSSPDGYHSFHVLTGGGRQWLLLALDWRASERGIAWAQGVLDSHPTLPTILTTHEVVAADDAGQASLSGYGDLLWNRLIRGNDQIFLALNGHYWPCGRTTLTNDAGHPVHLHITNYQDRYYGGAGMVRYYRFDLARGVIDVETFSPWLRGLPADRREPLQAEHAELSGDVERFTVEIDFEQRFAAFAPPVVPPPRPPSAVLVPGTVAYWRFDAAGSTPGPDGSPVAPGTVARDLTGHGNDLRAELLHQSAPEVLTWSAEHHRAQPAHASLRFDGGKGPDRGAVLRTGPGAPINGMAFLEGYTIETFIKLPEPFTGDHAFMGILSWEGRAGDAGKTSGWSPEEPTCSLNLSGERFLQFVVYPKHTDADPTSWSHALPTGRWTHVAVVNDGRRTIVYVDGSPIARNASEESRGIATLGKPFVIGATQFALSYGHGFYGWVGDTRVVARALRPEQFLRA
ncbi:LamG-like jellyroll fold domain-containing protein [Amycolatopsis albispora]|uniref:Tat pathway signal sequence domain protein n=1 Tax=Amycolatopsis albispora TaxID=1804986 RepID=A0A344L3Z7_9PSEU|nr:LamG-like jellyroll fold domain-containing protein [Amycolatopsis albispora]AXB42771.1 Tat pathway signal sequence domain protein [Amycolatopsis albispora]